MVVCYHSCKSVLIDHLLRNKFSDFLFKTCKMIVIMWLNIYNATIYSRDYLLACERF